MACSREPTLLADLAALNPSHRKRCTPQTATSASGRTLGRERWRCQESAGVLDAPVFINAAVPHRHIRDPLPRSTSTPPELETATARNFAPRSNRASPQALRHEPRASHPPRAPVASGRIVRGGNGLSIANSQLFAPTEQSRRAALRGQALCPSVATMVGKSAGPTNRLEDLNLHRDFQGPAHLPRLRLRCGRNSLPEAAPTRQATPALLPRTLNQCPCVKVGHTSVGNAIAPGGASKSLRRRSDRQQPLRS